MTAARVNTESVKIGTLRGKGMNVISVRCGWVSEAKFMKRNAIL